MLEMDLQELFLRVKNGDKDAFAQIYAELKRPVFAIACRIAQSREMAEDITQDVFVKLYVSPPDSSIKNPRAWAFRMARNLAIDAQRKRQSVGLDDVELPAEDEIGCFIMRSDIEAAISRLPCDEREIVTLHINAELHFNEIARIVGLSLPATYRKYRKAIKSLQNLLGGAL